MNKEILTSTLVIIIIQMISSQSLAEQYQNSVCLGVGQKFRSQKGKLSVSDKHYINSSKSLLWNWVANDTFQVTSPKIDSSLLLNYFYHTTQIWIYNQSPINESLIFQYLDGQSKVNYQFSFKLNYEGWRRILRSYLYDMNKIPKSTNNIAKVVVKAPPKGSGSIFFGSWKFVIPRQKRIRNLQMPDIAGFLSQDDYFLASTNTKDIQSSQPTKTQLDQMKQVRQRVIDNMKGNSAPSKQDLKKANQFYQKLNIIIQDGFIRGNFVSPISSNTFINVLSKDFLFNNNKQSLQRLEKILWLINDFGYASGSDLVYGWYDTIQYFNGLLLAYSYIKKQLQAKLFAALEWTFKMGEFWQKSPKLGWNSDYVHTNLKYVLASILICLDNSNQALVWLKGLKRFMQRKNKPSQDLSGWIKPDGTTFHHNSHYIAYLYSFNSYVNVLNMFDRTQFQINDVAYISFREAAYNLLIFSNKIIYSNSLCGRHPFNTKVPMTKQSYKNLAVIGGNILKTGLDCKIASAYNRVWGNEFNTCSTQLFPQGFWQFNYSPIGVYRRSGWVVTIHGMNSLFWGAQIYKNQNRFGRYQSYGSVQIIYGDQVTDVWQKGYNWNLPPGTTTKILPWQALNPLSQRADQKAASNFAASLRFQALKGNMLVGKYGMYGFDFKQMGNITSSHDSSFGFKSTKFCFNDLIICLGSNIASKDKQNPIVSTLFQSILSKQSSSVIINGQIIDSFPYHTKLQPGHHWITDSRGTSFYVNSKDTIIISKSQQTSPTQDNKNLQKGLFATAYIIHGQNPQNQGYEYVIIPGANIQNTANIKQRMNLKSSGLNQNQVIQNYDNDLYQILQKDEDAHIIHHFGTGIYAYSLFKANNNLKNGEYIASNSGPCLIMLRKQVQDLYVSIVDPSPAPLQNSTFTVSFNGKYTIKQRHNNSKFINYSNKGETVIAFSPRRGQSIDVILSILIQT